MKFAILSAASLLASASLTLATPLPDGETTTNTDSQPNTVPVRWNDVEAGVHAAQSSALAAAETNVQKREINQHLVEHKHGLNPAWYQSAQTATRVHNSAASPTGRTHAQGNGGRREEKREADPRKKSGAEKGGFRGGSGLWSRETKEISEEQRKRIMKEVEQREAEMRKKYEDAWSKKQADK